MGSGIPHDKGKGNWGRVPRGGVKGGVLLVCWLLGRDIPHDKGEGNWGGALGDHERGQWRWGG